MSENAPSQHPRHVAFIMDGNGRWATRKGLGRLTGHSAGVETVKSVCKELVKLEIPFATFYAFSTENWKRSEAEVTGLFNLMRTFFRKEMNEVLEKGLRIRFIGDRSPTSRLEPEILALMEEVEAKTAHNTKLTATFAINYGGHDELTRAARLLAEQVAAGQLKPHEITEKTFENALDTAGIPPVDLLVRTSGEQRTSNYLPWQTAYAELYFTETAWPDFDINHLYAALAVFSSRSRRFGAAPAATAA